MKENIKYEDIIKKSSREPIVYVIREIPGTQAGNPKISRTRGSEDQILTINGDGATPL